MARCRACKAEFALVRLLDDWRCRCPFCDVALASDGRDRATILRKAAAADRLETQLIETLSDIAKTDNKIDISIAPIIAKLLSGVDWQRQLRHDLSFAQRQIEHLQDETHQWADITSHADDKTDDDAGLSDGIHELANRLRKVGDAIDHVPQDNTSQGEASAVRAAAHRLDKTADDLANGRGSEPDVTAALGHATDALTDARASQSTNNPSADNENREAPLRQ